MTGGVAVLAPQHSASIGADATAASDAAYVQTSCSAADPAAEQPTAAPEWADEDKETVWRRRAVVAACLACDICRDVLIDPITAAECMHVYCRQCIDEFVQSPGSSNRCPVCKAAGRETMLGRLPYKEHLRSDFKLATLIRKIFPRPTVEAAVEAQRAARRQALHTALALGPRPASQGAKRARLEPSLHTRPAREVVELAAFPEAGVLVVLAEVAQPYLRVPRAMTVAMLGRYLALRLQQEAGLAADTQLLVSCRGAAVAGGTPLHEVQAQHWAGQAQGKVMLLAYRAAAPTEQHAAAVQERAQHRQNGDAVHGPGVQAGASLAGLVDTPLAPSGLD